MPLVLVEPCYCISKLTPFNIRCFHEWTLIFQPDNKQTFDPRS